MPISKQRLAELRSQRDEDIDYSDIPELGHEFFENARLVHPPGWQGWELVEMHVAKDVLDWFKSQYGDAYEVHLNSVLRSHMIDCKDVPSE